MKIGIDVGGTKCLGVAVDDNGKIVQQFRLPTPHADGLCDTLLEIVTQLGGASSLGIGVPGLISPEGVIRASPNLVGANELALREMVEDRLNIKVLVENEHLPEGIIDQSGEIKTEYPRKGIMEVDFSEKLEKLKLKYYSLSQEEEEFFDKVFKKYL